MRHQGLPTVPCPCLTSHLPTGAAQITISISLPGLTLLYAPHKLISPHPHHPLLHPLLDSPKCVHLPHESPPPATTPTTPNPRPSSHVPNVHPSPAPAPSGLETPRSRDGDGHCPRTCRWGSSPPSQSHPLQPCSHWPRSAPGSSGGTGGPLVTPALPHWPRLLGCPGTAQPPAPQPAMLGAATRVYGTRTMGCLGAFRTLEVRSRWKMPLECR